MLSEPTTLKKLSSLPNFASIGFSTWIVHCNISFKKLGREETASQLHIPGTEGSLLGPSPEDGLSMHFLKNLIFVRLFH